MIAMTCDRFDDRLAALMDGEVPPAERELLEAHAMECDRCGPLLSALQGIVREARSLPELQPSRDLWDGISTRIQAPVVPLEAHQASAVRRGLSWRAAAAAAAALVAVTALATWQIAGLTVDASDGQRVAAVTQPPAVPAVVAVPGADTPITAAPPSVPLQPPARPVDRARPSGPSASVTAVRNASSMEGTTAVYDREIASLRRMLDTRRAELDTTTVRLLEENLTIIDRAIEQSRQALARDPNSMFLIDHLNDALGRKVQLLRTVTLLPASS